MQIKEVMTKSVSYADPGTAVVELARRMRDEDVGAVPIAEDDRLVGMVTDRDIVVRAIASGRSIDGITAQDVMTNRMLFCSDDQDVNDVLANMGEQQVRRLPVVDADKRLVGVISLGDLARRAAPDRSGEALKEISAG
jgi:CBS domain-containing protein